MDSLSQIVLGAAVGEAVLGRKIGNRAMVWGAVAGTLPDMDVLGQFFLNELDNLAFHRGISHSLMACAIGSLAFGWLVNQLYQSPHHAKIAAMTKGLSVVLLGFVINFLTQIFSPGGFLPLLMYVPLAGWLFWRHVRRRYLSGQWERPTPNLKGWIQLFFWGFLTHIVLDCFTTYGTQVFAPFSDARVAWGTISVVDPLYTLPFLICLLVAARYGREQRQRRYWNWTGIGLSSVYLALTVVNHAHVKSTVESALSAQGIKTTSFFMTATIFNNVLWNVVVDSGEDEFLLAQYSIFDEVQMKFHSIPKGYELLHNLDSDETIAVLRWFSAGYFNAVLREDGSLQLNDLRFGTFSGKATSPDDYIFRFKLEDRGQDESYGFERAQGGPPDAKAEDMMKALIERAKGIPLSADENSNE
ncbi:MAG: metal-dependent hydrolase [Flavobacteriales bacterium]